MKKQMVIWITGLSGAGKTTLAHLLKLKITEETGIIPVLLDGDRLRSIFPVPLGYTENDRRLLAASYGRLAKEISSQDHVVICATISLFHEVHDWNRVNLPNYTEVWLRVPFEELLMRDRKGIYNSSENHYSISGIDISAEFPKTPDIIIDNHGKMTPQVAVNEIMKLIRR